MTDGEKMLWSATFARRLLDRMGKPPDSAFAPIANGRDAYHEWVANCAVDAAGCAADVVTIARATLAQELRPVAADMLREMLIDPPPVDIMAEVARAMGEKSNGDAGL